MNKAVRRFKGSFGSLVTLELADVPEDGGKWALYCQHDQGVGILQDTNRNRLSAWGSDSSAWCPFCQGILYYEGN
jgi:hypothetical protein